MHQRRPWKWDADVATSLLPKKSKLHALRFSQSIFLFWANCGGVPDRTGADLFSVEVRHMKQKWIRGPGWLLKEMSHPDSTKMRADAGHHHGRTEDLSGFGCQGWSKEASSTSRLLSIPSGSNKLLEKVLSSILNVASTAVCILWCTFLGQALQWDVKRSLHPTGSLRILGLDHFPQLLLKWLLQIRDVDASLGRWATVTIEGFLMRGVSAKQS